MITHLFLPFLPARSSFLLLGLDLVFHWRGTRWMRGWSRWRNGSGIGWSWRSRYVVFGRFWGGCGLGIVNFATRPSVRMGTSFEPCSWIKSTVVYQTSYICMVDVGVPRASNVPSGWMASDVITASGGANRNIWLKVVRSSKEYVLSTGESEDRICWLNS